MTKFTKLTPSCPNQTMRSVDLSSFDWAHPRIAPKLRLRIGCLLFSREPKALGAIAQNGAPVRLATPPTWSERSADVGPALKDQSDALSLTGKFQMLHGTRRCTMQTPDDVPGREAFNASTAGHHPACDL